MKPKSLQSIAALTVATLAIAIYQQHREDHPPMPNAKDQSGPVGQENIALTADAILPKVIPQKPPSSRVSANPSATQLTTGPSIPTRPESPHHERYQSNAQDGHSTSSNTGAARESSPISPPNFHPARTIQLASNFQLPAVLLAAASPAVREADTPKTPVEQATQAIVDDFYRNLAERLPTEVSTDAETILPELPVEENIVIAPDTETDSVRRHADELYRALFGDEAFGRKGMEGTLEVHLPESPNEASH